MWNRHIGYIEFPAVVSDGVAYISNLGGTVRALRMLDGKRLWFRKIRHGKSASSPAVVGDDLVVHGMDGNVRVLDRSNGRVRWRFHIGSPVESSPVVSHGIDYFGAWNGNVYALDLRTRRLRWVFRSGYKITSSAALSGGKLFIGITADACGRSRRAAGTGAGSRPSAAASTALPRSRTVASSSRRRRATR